MVKRGSTNQKLLGLIVALKKHSTEKKVGIWEDIALRLSKSTRSRYEVNLSKIERHSGEGETVIVPGKVLSAGRLTKKINVAAWRFSAQARDEIKKAGGRCLTIEELMKENPSGTGLKILK